MYLIDKARVRPYKLTEYIRRVIWYPFSLVFYCTPRTFWRIRIWILRINGAKIGSKVRIYRTVKIHAPWRLSCEDNVTIGEYVFIYNLGYLKIGKSSTVSFKSQIIGGGHDIRHEFLPLERYNITIGSNVFLGANVHLLGNIVLTDDVVIGYGTLLTKSVLSSGVYFSKSNIIKKEL